MKKRTYCLLSVLIVGILLVGCGKKETEEKNTEKKNLTLGFYIGPYRDHFTEVIQPILEKEGYTITIKDFTDPIAIPTALQEEEIDASFSMSTAYAEGFNKDHGSHFVRATYTTSAPQGIYSKKHKTLTEVKDGMTIGVPNDPVNEERAFRILEELGWVKIKNDAQTIDFSIDSILPGDYNLTFKEIDSTQLVASLPDLDYAIINGNIAIDAGYNIGKDSLLVEETPNQHRVVMVVNQDNENATWTKDIREAYLSKEFQTYFDKNLKSDGFLAPIPNDQ